MNDNLESKLRRVVRSEANNVPDSISENWPHPASRMNSSKPINRRWKVAGITFLLLIASVSSAFLVHSHSIREVAAEGLKAAATNGGLGPGCGLPGVDLATSGSVVREGKPVISGVVGMPIIIQVNVDPDRPQLKTTATVIVASPGTIPGRGFANPSQNVPGSSSLDDSGNWKASVNLVAQMQTSVQQLTFVPTLPGLYPVYVIEHATSTVTSPPLCGGIPDKGGDAQNVVGWIQVP